MSADDIFTLLFTKRYDYTSIEKFLLDKNITIIENLESPDGVVISMEFNLCVFKELNKLQGIKEIFSGTLSDHREDLLKIYKMTGGKNVITE